MSIVQKAGIRYPDARVKALRDVFDLVQTESDWRPSQITQASLKTLGIGKSKERNTIFALRFLGIVDSDGAPTAEFDNLRQDFQPTLKRLVTKAYSHLLETVPLRRMTQKSLVVYFGTHGYEVDTAEYQAMLFSQLCKLADIALPNIETAFKRARFKDSV